MKKIFLGITISLVTLLAGNIAYATILGVQQGGTGASSFGQGWLYSSGRINSLNSSTSPTVNYITSTSTTDVNRFYGSAKFSQSLEANTNGILDANGIPSEFSVIPQVNFGTNFGVRVGINTSNPQAQFHVVSDGFSSTANEYFDTYSGGIFSVPLGSFIFRTARGVAGSGTALNSGDLIGFWGGRAYGTTGFPNTSSVGVSMMASEDQTDTAHGGYMDFETTPNGSVFRTERMRIDQNGNIGIATTSPYAKLSVVGQTVAAYFTATTTTASTFPYASTTMISATTASTTNQYVSSLARAAGTFVAADPTGKLIATTSPSGGGTAAGSLGQIQFNNGSGAFTATSSLFYSNAGAGSLKVTGSTTITSSAANDALIVQPGFSVPDGFHAEGLQPFTVMKIKSNQNLGNGSFGTNGILELSTWDDHIIGGMDDLGRWWIDPTDSGHNPGAADYSINAAARAYDSGILHLIGLNGNIGEMIRAEDDGGSGHFVVDNSYNIDTTGTITAEGDITTFGKVNSSGGLDPAYLTLDTETNQQIKDRMSFEIPPSKQTGFTMFWNGTNLLGITVNASTSVASLYKIPMTLVSTTTVPNVFSSAIKVTYYFDPMTGNAKESDTAIPVKYRLKKGYKLNPNDGSYYLASTSQAVTKTEAVEQTTQ